MPKIKGVDTVPVQIRRGDMQDFVPDNLLQGEPAFADDNGTHRFFIGTGNDAKAIELARQDEIQRATQAQAHQGTDNNMIMTPLRTKEHVDYRIASQGQALNGTDNSTLITPLRANDLYNDRTQKCYSVTASDSSYIYIYVTDSYVSDVDGAEIIIKPSRTITATSCIYLNLNGNSLIITKPTGMPSDYVTTLTKDVPYRLKRTIVGSSSRWVAMNYPVERYSFLGQTRLVLPSSWTVPTTGENAIPLSGTVGIDNNAFQKNISDGVRINNSLDGNLYLEHSAAIYFFTGDASYLNGLITKADSTIISRGLSHMARYTTFSTGTLLTSVNAGQAIRLYFDGTAGDEITSQIYMTYLQLKLFKKNY